MTDIRKVVINTCVGGFELSYEAVMEYAKIKGIQLYGAVEDADSHRKNNILEWTYLPYNPETMKDPWLIFYSTKPLKNGHIIDCFSESDILRDDPVLVAVIEKLGVKANGRSANLKIVEIPADVQWEIDEYDGREHIQEKHREWC